MHCFDADFAIRKFDCIGDVLEAFLVQRLPAYEQRRIKQLEQLVKEVTELEAKRAFLKAILEDRLTLMRKTDEEIVTGLKTCGIPPLSDTTNPDSVHAYEYVLRLRIDRLKASAVLELEKEVEERHAVQKGLEGITPSAMWLRDLEEFKEVWLNYKEARVAEMAVSGTKEPTTKKKRLVVKKRGTKA